MDAGEAPRKKQKKRGFCKTCVAMAKAVGAGGDEEDGGLDDAVGDAGESINSTAPHLPLTARMQAIEQEIQRFTLEKGLDDDDDNDNDDVSTGEDNLRWRCWHEFAYSTLVRLAKTVLAIPASSAASEGVFSVARNVVSKKRTNLEDDTVDAFVVLHYSH